MPSSKGSKRFNETGMTGKSTTKSVKQQRKKDMEEKV
jgi:hypothetical protein